MMMYDYCDYSGDFEFLEKEVFGFMKGVMNVFAKMLEEAPADALLDSPPGVSCPAVTVTRDADLILLVADPTPFGFHDFKLAHQAFKPLGKPICAAVNRAGAEGNEAGDAAVRSYCRENGLPLLAELPFERAAAEQYAAGRLLADLSPEWRERFTALRDALRAEYARVKEADHA